MLGAIIGDILGSPFERGKGKILNKNPKEVPLFAEGCKFTDDTVMTLATAHVLMTNNWTPDKAQEYAMSYRFFAKLYPGRGYGGMFKEWIEDDTKGPYNSFGNGSAMRVSPIGFFFQKEEDVLSEAKISAEVTHNHPEGIKGAQATALAIFLACQGQTKIQIRDRIEANFGYDLKRTFDQIAPTYKFDVTCQGSVPEAIICFLEAGSYEETIRMAIALGGDTDTQACIAGGIAEGFYKTIPLSITEKAADYVDPYITGLVAEFRTAAKNARRKK